MTDEAKPSEISHQPAVLVVGAGIAGMQAALEVADSEHQVYLVERLPTVGGRMMQLDKTFPTMDCAACIGTPKMSQVGSNKYINLLTCSEVTKVSGYAGNFKVTVHKKSKFVDISNCTSCGECAKVCPVSRPSEWQEGMAQRKAVYRPFPQAVPNVFTIDKRGLPPCRATCPAGVNSQGYIALISQGKFKEALEVVRRTMPFAGVCGRICTQACEKECERGKFDEPIAIRLLKRFAFDNEIEMVKSGKLALPDEKIPAADAKKVAVVGAGPAGLTAAVDLADRGYSVTVYEAAPSAGGMLRWGIPEYRLPKNIVDYEIELIRRKGIKFVYNTRIGKDIALETLRENNAAVFLSLGMQSSRKLGVEGEDKAGISYGVEFLRQASDKSNPPEIKGKVLVVGGGNVAVDVARTARRLGAAAVEMVCLEQRYEMPASPEEITATLAENITINNGWGPKRILGNGKVNAIELKRCTRVYDGNRRFSPVYDDNDTTSIKADLIIVAIGQALEKQSIDTLGITTERGSFKADPVTLQTSINNVFAGGDSVTGPKDVINAVAQGKEAAISIDRYLTGIDLKADRPEPRVRVKDVDKTDVVKKARQQAPELEVKDRQGFTEVELGFDENSAVEEAQRCLNCGVCSECMSCVAVCERKAIHHEMKDEDVDLEVGAIIVTTGYDLLDPTPMTQYGYGRFPNVYTSLEFERMVNSTGFTEGHIQLKDGSIPKSAAVVHCIGSRDHNYHEYCSRICCMYGLKHAHLIREKTGANVYQCYIDMRCFGKGYEEFYKRISDEGVNFIRGKVTQVTDIAQTDEEKGKLVVICEDTLLGAMIRLPVDMVILNVAVEPRQDAKEVAKIFGIEVGADGFFNEKHYKLDTMGTLTDGIFMAGCNQGPKDIPDTVSQAIGAAAKAIALVSHGEKKRKTEGSKTEASKAG
jgi:heterodisulfide reductase subunit A2